MVSFSNPIDDFFVQLLAPLTRSTPTELVVAILVNLTYFYGLYLLYFLYRYNRKDLFVRFLISIFVGFLLVFSIKYIVDRPRPFQTFGLNAVLIKEDPSFPSAHAFLAFVFFYFISKIRKLKKFHLLIASHLLIIVPLGLMIMEVHYFTDVFAGALIGYLIPLLITNADADWVYHKVFLDIFSNRPSRKTQFTITPANIIRPDRAVKYQMKANETITLAR